MLFCSTEDSEVNTIGKELHPSLNWRYIWANRGKEKSSWAPALANNRLACRCKCWSPTPHPSRV